VQRADTARGFDALPRRCVVARTVAALGRCRPLARDRARTAKSAKACPASRTSAAAPAASHEPAITQANLNRTLRRRWRVERCL
jgi:transposase